MLRITIALEGRDWAGPLGSTLRAALLHYLQLHREWARYHHTSSLRSPKPLSSHHSCIFYTARQGNTRYLIFQVFIFGGLQLRNASHADGHLHRSSIGALPLGCRSPVLHGKAAKQPKGRLPLPIGTLRDDPPHLERRARNGGLPSAEYEDTQYNQHLRYTHHNAHQRLTSPHVAGNQSTTRPSSPPAHPPELELRCCLLPLHLASDPFKNTEGWSQCQLKPVAGLFPFVLFQPACSQYRRLTNRPLCVSSALGQPGPRRPI